MLLQYVFAGCGQGSRRCVIAMQGVPYGFFLACFLAALKGPCAVQNAMVCKRLRDLFPDC